MKNEKITLMVGLFDKNTKKQKINTKEAMNIINNILLQYVEGATIYLGSGIYRHIDKTTVVEPNIIIILYDINKEALDKIITECKQQLNQEAIGIEKTVAEVQFI